MLRMHVSMRVCVYAHANGIIHLCISFSTQEPVSIHCTLRRARPWRWPGISSGSFWQATLQGKTPWVDSACADCPGFLSLECCPRPGFHLRLGASDCAPGLAFCFMAPWTFARICCPQLPDHRCKNGTHSTCFYSTGGHAPNPPQSCDRG